MEALVAGSLLGRLPSASSFQSPAEAPTTSRRSLRRTSFLGEVKTLRGRKLVSNGAGSSRMVETGVVPIIVATATAPAPTSIKYALPTWAKFEMGHFPVFWETSTGRPPASGEGLSIYFNPSASKLVPNNEYGIGFNGGFNSPIMCGGEPRVMTKKERGPDCAPFFSIKINVPVHATHIEFSFTDGKEWDGPYVVDLDIPAKWRNQPASFFNQRLAEELSREGACEVAIYPEAPFVQDRCLMPGGILHEAGLACSLDINPGCTDPESPFYDPLATHDDGSCALIPDA